MVLLSDDCQSCLTSNVTIEWMAIPDQDHLAMSCNKMSALTSHKALSRHCNSVWRG